MGVGGVALGHTLARTLKVIILAIGLRKRLAPVDWRPVIDFTLRLNVAVAVMGMVVAAAIRYPVMPRSRCCWSARNCDGAAVGEPAQPRRPARPACSILSRFAGTREMLGNTTLPSIPGGAEDRPCRRLEPGAAREALYEEARFAEVNLSDQTWDRIAARPTGATLLRLNRVLLEEAYPNRFAPVGQRRYPHRAAAVPPADLDHKARLSTRCGRKDPSHLRSQLAATRAHLKAYPAAGYARCARRWCAT